MKLKKRFLLLAISLLCMALFQSVVVAAHPAQDIMQLYAGDIKDQKTIEPYIVSILALNEVENGRNFPQVKQFIQWYFSKLNYPDLQGLSGTIYVYTLADKLEQSTRKYDSVDGYAGMFLHLLRQYAVKTGDIQLLRDNWTKIEDIAALIPALQDKDGLTWATPKYRVKYLMDNCESYGGITAYLDLRNMVGLGGSLKYHVTLIMIQQGILAELFDTGNAMFFWAKVEDGGKSQSAWNQFYPDALAQIFPVYYGLLADMIPVRSHLWGEFVKIYGTTMPGVPVEQRILYELAKKKMERTGRP